MEIVKFIISATLIFTGLIVFYTSAVGNFKYAFILNRMQVSAVTDTFGALLVIMGLVIISGFNMTSLKLVIMIIFMWFANPVASHFLAKTEVIVNDDIVNECEVIRNDDV